jgi:integrase
MRKPRVKRGRYGDGSVYLRGRIWWMTWYDQGEKVHKSTEQEDRKVAQRMLRTELQRVGGRRPTVLDPQKVYYEQLRENLLNHYVMKRLRSLKTDGEGNPTVATLPRLDKFFGGWRANEITVTSLKRFRADALKDGLSDARANRYMATLRVMFNQAVKDELITEKPAYFPTTTEPNEARGYIYIKDEWYAPMRKALKEPLRSAFTLAYHVGVRVEEMLRIRWSDVDLKKRIVTIHSDVAKTGVHRLVPLPSDFALEPGEPDALVFPLGNYRWRWYKACVAAGTGRWEKPEKGRRRYVGLTMRHTRHTASRNMDDAGMEKARIKAITGHKTDSMFYRYNIGLEGDVEMARRTIERFHKKRQRKL